MTALRGWWVGSSGLRVVLALTAALAVLFGSSLPVGAFSVIVDDGQQGNYNFNESMANPRVRCGYSSYLGDKSYFRWMRVKPPQVYAPDTSAEKIDSMRVGWRFLIQRQTAGSSTWTTVAKSPVQKARAYENSPASFSKMKVYFSASKITPIFRAVVVINWYGSDGSRVGQIKLLPDHYEAKQGTSIFYLGNPDCPGGSERV